MKRQICGWFGIFSISDLRGRGLSPHAYAMFREKRAHIYSTTLQERESVRERESFTKSNRHPML
jgi:hypothetical protein